MSNLRIINANIDDLDMLYDTSAFTMVGLVESDIPDLVEWVCDNCGASKDADMRVYVIKGEMMNYSYELRGNVAYAHDLTIVSMPLPDISEAGGDIGKLAIARFNLGCRWFDDIVDNNAAHMRELDAREIGD